MTSLIRKSNPVNSSTRLAMFSARSPTRSRSLEMRNAPTISRRSTAIGWRRAMVVTAFSSISRCNASTRSSAAMTRLASAVSRFTKASVASAICSSSRRPMSAILLASSCRSVSNDRVVCSIMMARPTLRPGSSVQAIATDRARGLCKPGVPRAGRGPGVSLLAELGFFGPLDGPSP